MIFTYFYRNQRAKPIIIDPGLYLSKKSDLALTTQRRSLPTSFTLFTGKHVYIYAQILLKKKKKGGKKYFTIPPLSLKPTNFSLYVWKMGKYLQSYFFS